MSSSSLVQNYSLLYASNGPLYNKRVGWYNVSLGYNWTALDTTFKSSTQPTENYNQTRGHLLYNGEINLDPKEVPFKLNAYSRDITRNSISNSSGRGMQNFASILGNRDEATNINDGIHIESGATLIAGVKNGMTNGYNEFLRHFPMILVDYKDSINRDLRSSNPVDDRLSRLAFVSLNKKDNWFHYRHTLYNDYINFSNNYVENEVQIGTVDQYMARRWIDFTNWIKVSTDLQLSKRKSNYQTDPIEEINLNLFVVAERKTWNARSFTSFNRYRDEYNKLSYQTALPIYASGDASQDLSWSARSSFRSNHDADASGATSKFTNSLVGYRVDAFKRAPFTLSQGFDVESSQTDSSDFLTLSGRVETTTTSRFSRTVSLGASYNVKNSSTTSSTASDSNFIEHQIDLRGGYVATNTLRLQLHQSNTFTRGSFTPLTTSTRNSETQLAQYANPRNFAGSDAGTDSYHSTTTLSASWNPKPRLNSHITLIEDIFKSSVLSTSSVTEVLAGVSFSNDAWSMNDTLRYSYGSRDASDNNANSVSNTASLRYIHSRNLDASASASYSYSRSMRETLSDVSLEQRVNYSYFTKAGISRKLLEFNETFLHSDGMSRSNSEYTNSIMLGLKYYPISQLTLAGGIGYSFTNPVRDYTLVWNTSVAANFRLLQASLDYVHGIRKLDGARENKFTGNIRKSF